MTTGSTLWWEIRMTRGWLVAGGGAGPGGGAPSVDESTVVEEGGRDEAWPEPGVAASAPGAGGGRAPLPVMVTVVPTLIWKRDGQADRYEKQKSLIQSTGDSLLETPELHPQAPCFLAPQQP